MAIQNVETVYTIPGILDYHGEGNLKPGNLKILKQTKAGMFADPYLGRFAADTDPEKWTSLGGTSCDTAGRVLHGAITLGFLPSKNLEEDIAKFVAQAMQG